jgi:glycosyltransferase involved in cell wall biosynthesis
MVGPGSGGVRDAIDALAAAMDGPLAPVQLHHLDGAGMSAWRAMRLAWRCRRTIAGGQSIHVEFGSNDRGPFWFAVIAASRSRRVIAVVHDLPKVILSPGAGLAPLDRRLGSILGHRVLSPLLDRVLVRHLLARAQIVVLSDPARHEMRGRGVDAAVVPLAGPARTTDAPPPSEGQHVLFAGYLGPSKGIEDLLEAWKGGVAEGRVPLVIAGDTEPGRERYVATLRRRAEATPGVIWRGAVADEQDFQRLFAEAAIVALPYRYSSPGSSVLMRAMAEGRCIVVTPVPAAAALADGRDARIVPMDDPPALGRAVAALLDDPSERDRLGRGAARSSVERTWERSAAAFRAIHAGW